jgi:hypothetical protein
MLEPIRDQGGRLSRLAGSAAGEDLDWGVEPVTTGAADSRSLDDAGGCMQGVPVFHLSRKRTSSPAAFIHVRGTVQEDHVGLLISTVQAAGLWRWLKERR